MFCHACMCFYFEIILCTCQGRFRIPKLLILYPPPLLWSASQITIGSWYFTIWTLDSGGHHNYLLFADEDEEESDSCWGVCIVFHVTPEFKGGSYTISVIRDRHAEQILIRNCLAVWFCFLKPWYRSLIPFFLSDGVIPK